MQNCNNTLIIFFKEIFMHRDVLRKPFRIWKNENFGEDGTLSVTVSLASEVQFGVTYILCQKLGAEGIGRISWLPRAPLGPIFMTGLPER